MQILYKNTTVEKQFSSIYKNKWKYPEPVKIKLCAIENAIKSAKSLYDISLYKPYRFHKLEGRRKEEWSISVGNTGYRITLIPCDDDENPITSGDIMVQCKKIKVILVTEVSNHYE